MPRELSDRDREILKKLAPECAEEICAGSGHAFRSILPPVANHFATGEADFAGRIGRLTDDDLRYLVDLVRDGGESLGCVPPELLSLFLQMVADRLGRRQAEELVMIYAQEGECELEEGEPPHGD
jgi:hypothetical protein